LTEVLKPHRRTGDFAEWGIHANGWRRQSSSLVVS
jgi:hypothetical protein